MPVALLAGAILGPLLVARVRHLPPAPGGIVVRPDAPKLDMAVVVDASGLDDPIVKPLVATLTGQRPQPAVLVVESGVAVPAGVEKVVEIQRDVVMATPEALDRIAAELDQHDSIAVYPWIKTTKRADALAMWSILTEALGSGVFSIVPLGSSWEPTSVRAYKAGSADKKPRVYGGHVVAQAVGTKRSNGKRSVVATVLTQIYLASALAAFVYMLGSPSWESLGLYALYVLSLSVCLRQIAKLPRASALIYPVVLVASLGHAFMSAIQRPKPVSLASL
ncbi:MAG: hypothetical protein Q8K63_03680 [Acidimicrobiales bacterium]|nr:hypothetical protein [Acidimicrobiales bacterium]